MNNWGCWRTTCAPIPQPSHQIIHLASHQKFSLPANRSFCTISIQYLVGQVRYAVSKSHPRTAISPTENSPVWVQHKGDVLHPPVRQSLLPVDRAVLEALARGIDVVDRYA